MSTRADFLPPSYCRELTKLQENLEPITHEHAEVTLSEELDIVTTNEVFAGASANARRRRQPRRGVQSQISSAAPDGPRWRCAGVCLRSLSRWTRRFFAGASRSCFARCSGFDRTSWASWTSWWAESSASWITAPSASLSSASARSARRRREGARDLAGSSGAAGRGYPSSVPDRCWSWSG